WTLLYLLMGLAAWRAWSSRGFRAAAPALAVFAVQLVLNAAWSWIFFGLHRPLLALADLVLLWIAILTTLLLFMKLSRLAGWLLAPYLIWVAYAGLLNAALWRLN
ncbi:MAG: tryptophan-rich sensory protein, partial [Acidobacteriota bacterium]